MRCRSTIVSPVIAGALLIAVTMILVSRNSGDTVNSSLIAVLAGGYVIFLPKRRCGCSGKRAVVGEA